MIAGAQTIGLEMKIADLRHRVAELEQDRGQAVTELNDDIYVAGVRPQALSPEERRDLDESRRLLYMVLMGAMEGERWYSVGGTIVNALAHHSGIVDAEQVMENLRKIRNGVGSADALMWVRAVVARINERLDSD